MFDKSKYIEELLLGNPKLKEFVIVKYKFQRELCKENPLSMGIFNSLEIAEPIRKHLHLNEWKEIIKEGISNDTFSYYAEVIKSKGYNFAKDANMEEIHDFVEFIDNGEVDNPYTNSKANLKALRIVETIPMGAEIILDSDIRYLIKEDDLFYTGEIYKNIENSKYGTPMFITNHLDLAKKKLEELEYHYFIDKVLSNLQSSSYWKDTIYVEKEILDEIKFKLNQKRISFYYPKDIDEVREIREILIEIVGIGILDNFYSIDTFELNELKEVII